MTVPTATPYRVYHAGLCVAAFRTERAARDWAMTLPEAEIHHRTSLIGQYRFGQSSEEFRHHHEACYNPIR